jgi:hypothetical protein
VNIKEIKFFEAMTNPLPIPRSFLLQKFSKRWDSAYLPKVKPSAGPLFLRKKTSMDRKRVLKYSLKL